MNDPLDEADLPLPPRRALPPQVRARMRETVFRQLPGRSRLDRIRPPLAVAASVAVLAAGAMIVAQSVDGGDDGPLLPPPSTAATTPEPPPLDPEAARVNLDRCATALQTAGKAGSVPARDAWMPVFALPNQGRTVTAVRAAGRPLFCETTRTTVTVSDPNATPGYAKDSATAALLISKDGAMAGIVDPAWQSMVVLTVSTGGGSEGAPAFIKDGLWIQFTNMATRPGARFTVRQTIPGHPEQPHPVGPGGVSTPAKPGEVVPGQTHPELDLPRAPEPLVSLTDQQAKPGDRTSDRGAFLGECIAKSSDAVADADAWEPVAITGTAPYRAVLARYGEELIACGARGYQTDPNDLTKWTIFHEIYRQYRPIEATSPIPFVFGVGIGEHNSEALLGLVRSDVASMELLAPGRDPLQVPIENGAFAVSYPIQPVAGPDRPDFTVVLRDQAGNEIERGPLPDYI